jgi:hypothetical protein
MALLAADEERSVKLTLPAASGDLCSVRDDIAERISIRSALTGN